jgi:hypothetical protein
MSHDQHKPAPNAPRKVSREWFQKLATSIMYHHGTNDPEGIYWPEAKAMLLEAGLEVEGEAKPSTSDGRG